MTTPGDARMVEAAIAQAVNDSRKFRRDGGYANEGSYVLDHQDAYDWLRDEESYLTFYLKALGVEPFEGRRALLALEASSLKVEMETVSLLFDALHVRARKPAEYKVGLPGDRFSPELREVLADSWVTLKDNGAE